MTDAENRELDTAVVGAGVGGLYAAWKLAESKPAWTIEVFEASQRCGGRIETREMDGFLAEFGPMRFEEPGQTQLMKLLKDLRLRTRPFSAYTAAQPEWPKYQLKHDEIPPGDPYTTLPYTSLELLKLGILRILNHEKNPSGWRSPDNAGPRDDAVDEWWEKLNETTYDDMRRNAWHGTQLESHPLHTYGFWNALSDVLSPGAIMKIRDIGTFYHLIPENPNAAEWTIFWLRGLHPKDKLVGIVGGSTALTQALVNKLENWEVDIHLGNRLIALEPTGDDTVELQFEVGDSVVARHVILALPRSPLLKLREYFTPQIKEDLDAVFGFPLLKCFFVTDKPWWKPDTPPQTRASMIPTREVHYYRSPLGRPVRGMVMLYTDRPATEYWKPYVEGKVHNQAEINRSQALRLRFFKYLAEDIQAAAEKDSDGGLAASHFDPEVLELSQDRTAEQLGEELAQTVSTWGIRDWSREPYGAACHTWRPGAKSWEVLDRLKAFGLPNDVKAGNVHICGEAYSNYNGFIEGALLTADSVVSNILT